MGTKKFLINFGLINFGLGFIAGIFLLSIMRSLGIPTFETFLAAAFGEDNIWALVFSALMILLVMIGIFKTVDKKDKIDKI